MNNRFKRTDLLLGAKNRELLSEKSVVIFGIGGVGGFSCEAIARCAVGEMTIVDYDVVDISNINRQIIALSSTLGMKKIDIMESRLLDINPKLKINKFDIRIDEETICDEKLIEVFKKADYIIDAIDSIDGKIAIIKKAHEYGVKIISSMGTGNKIDPMNFKFCDVFETKMCPFARKFRTELRKRKIEKLMVVFSDEQPLYSYDDRENLKTIGSVSFVPPVVGLMIASKVIRDIVNK